MPVSLALPDHSISFRARLCAPLLTLGTIALLEAVYRLFHILTPSPSPVFLLVLACGVFVSGLRSGLLSAVVVLVYLAFFLHGAEGPWLAKPTIVGAGRMALMIVVAPSIVIIIGLLKRRLLAAERASAASQRQQAEELLRLATETAGIGTFSYDPAEGGRMNLSDQARVNCGLAPDATLDFTTFTEQILAPADHARFTAALRAALQPSGSGVYAIECRVRRPNDGLERWLAIRGRALLAAPGGGQRVVVGATIDITDRKEAEKDLLLLKAAVESANDGIIITEAALDLPGPRIEYVNPAFCRMTGYSIEELIGQTPRILQGPDTDLAMLHTLRGTLHEAGTFHAETVNYRKGGEPYYVEWRITAVNDAAGKLTQWVAIQRDVTARFHAEQARVRAEREREQMLEAERGTRLELERAGRLKDEFLATLSHELRTPLNAIVGWVHLLKGEPDNLEMQRSAIEVIERNAKSQVQLIEDLLDVSRIVSGKMRLEVRSVELVDVVEAALDAARPTAATRGVRIEPVLDPRAGPVSGDPDRLQQVVWNLLSNALKFTPKGGRVQLRLERAGSRARITVSDTGQGIAPEFLPHIFERFRQADSSSTRSHSGLGIGLALVRHLVELHGGTVEAASDGAGLGATFTVNLPMPVAARVDGEPREGAANPTAASRPPGALQGLRIVAVDDDADARELLTAILSTHGADVATAANVEDGLTAILQHKPDLLLCDIEMPREDGYSMISKVRRLAANEGGAIPAVALTAYAREDDQRRALLAGFQRHLSKPVDPLELVSALATLVRPSNGAGGGDKNPAFSLP